MLSPEIFNLALTFAVPIPTFPFTNKDPPVGAVEVPTESDAGKL